MKRGRAGSVSEAGSAPVAAVTLAYQRVDQWQKPGIDSVDAPVVPAPESDDVTEARVKTLDDVIARVADSFSDPPADAMWPLVGAMAPRPMPFRRPGPGRPPNPKPPFDMGEPIDENMLSLALGTNKAGYTKLYFAWRWQQIPGATQITPADTIGWQQYVFEDSRPEIVTTLPDRVIELAWTLPDRGGGYMPPLRYFLTVRPRDAKSTDVFFSAYMELKDILLYPTVERRGYGSRIVFELQHAAMRLGVTGILATFCHLPFVTMAERNFSGWLDYYFDRTRGQAKPVDDGPFFPERVGQSAQTIVAQWALGWATPAAAALAHFLYLPDAARGNIDPRAFKGLVCAVQDWLVHKRQRGVAEAVPEALVVTGGSVFKDLVVTLDEPPDDDPRVQAATHALLDPTAKFYGRGHGLCVHVQLAEELDAAPLTVDVLAILFAFFVDMARTLVAAVRFDAWPPGSVFARRWREVMEHMLVTTRPNDDDHYHYRYELPGNFAWPDFEELSSTMLYAVPLPRRPRPMGSGEGAALAMLEPALEYDTGGDSRQLLSRMLGSRGTATARGDDGQARKKRRDYRQCLLCDRPLDESLIHYCANAPACADL